MTPKTEINSKHLVASTQEKSKPNKPDLKAAKTVKTPIKISVMKVSLGIFDSQYLHFPLKKKKEKNGTKSLVFNSVLQEKQIERLFKKDKPVPYLFATTQTKLPKATPNKNIIIPNKYCINYIIPQKSKNAP